MKNSNKAHTRYSARLQDQAILKLLENHSRVAVTVNLKEPVLKKTYVMMANVEPFMIQCRP